MRKRKIDTGDAPQQNERKAPEPEGAVKIPANSWEMRAPAHGEAASPVQDFRPPYNRTS
jgi:hypothetical protein